MPKCYLNVEITNPKEQYAPGDVIDVIVHVETSDSVSCKDLSLELGWRTHGSGNEDSGAVSTQSLFAGEWSAGMEEMYRTQIKIPRSSKRAPMSYHGRHVNIDWHLEARADIPWAFDPKADQRIFIAADPGAVPPYEPPSVWPTEGVSLSGNRGCLMAIAIFGLIAGTVFLFLKGPWVAALFFVPAAIAGRFAWKEHMVSERIGEVGFGVAPDHPTTGGELHAFVQFAPPGRLEIESVRVIITANEIAVSGSGTNKTTYNHKLLSESQVKAEGHRIDPGDMLELDFGFQLPPGLPPSFSSNNNDVKWALRMEVKVRGAKKLGTNKELFVCNP